MISFSTSNHGAKTRNSPELPQGKKKSHAFAPEIPPAEDKDSIWG
jgi:hypothetical protein